MLEAHSCAMAATAADDHRGHRRLRPGRCLLLLVVLTLVGVACGSAEETGGVAADAAASEGAAVAASDPAAVDDDSPEAADDAADATITGVDYAFEVGDVSAGDTVEFVNASNEEAHEMVVMRVTDDTVTLDDILQILQEDPEAEPPEFLEEAGFAFSMPGETAEQTVTFDAGRYLLLCFIPQNAPPELVAQMMDPTTTQEPEIPSEVEAQLGPPHAVEGMIDLIEVE